MDNNEKDNKIKVILQKDKVISPKAESIFSNMKYEKTKELKNHKFFSKILTTAATFLVIALSVTGAIYYNKGKFNVDTNTSVTTESSKIVNQDPNAKVNIIIKNKEVELEEDKVIKQSENELIKAVLLENNKLALKLKDKIINDNNWNIDSSKLYEVSNVENTIKDIFVGYIQSNKYPYVMLIMDDSTVECVQIFNGDMTNGNELSFFDQGKVLGLTDIIGFEQGSEKSTNSDEMYYYISAIRSDGIKKQIELGKYNDMENLSTNKKSFLSQDGSKTYTINANEGDYYQATGYVGASNNVYYIYDGCLYHLSLTDGTKTKLVTGVSKIWMENDEKIVVKLDYVNTIHKQDLNITLSRYDVTESEVIDTIKNENMILMLKKDGTITVEFIKGGIKSIYSGNTYIKECIRYNFYAHGYSKQNGAEENIFANANAMFLGTFGTKGTNCIAYATKGNKVVVIDLAKCLEKSQGSMIATSNDAIIAQGNYPNEIQSFEKGSVTIRLQDATELVCDTINVVYTNGNKADVPASVILNKEGYSNYTVM